MSESLSVDDASEMSESLRVDVASAMSESLRVGDASEMSESLRVGDTSEMSESLRVGDASEMSESLSVDDASEMSESLREGDTSELSESLRVDDASEMSESLRVDDASEKSDEEQGSDLQQLQTLLEELRCADKPGGLNQEGADNGTKKFETLMKAERKLAQTMKEVTFKPGDNPKEVMQKMSTAEEKTGKIKSFFKWIKEKVQMIKRIPQKFLDLLKTIFT